MRVTDTQYNRSLVDQMQTLQERQQRLQTQVSTGQRLQKPGDDPRAMGRVLSLQYEQRANTQYARNIDRANEVSNVSFDNYQSLQDIADRASEIIILSSGVQSADARDAYSHEVDQLLEQAVMISNSRHRGEFLFAGAHTDQAPFEATRDATTNEITVVDRPRVSDPASFEISDNSFVSPYPSSDVDAGVHNMLVKMVELRDALVASDTTQLSALQADFETVEDDMIGAMSEIAAVQMRLEVASAQQETRTIEVESLISTEADADITDSIVKLNQVQLAYEAALQTGARMLNQSLLNYI